MNSLVRWGAKMFLWALIPLCLYINAVSALTLDAAYVKRLSQAKSARQIRTLTKSYELLRESRKACRIQLRTKTIPLACFETLMLERHWKIGSGQTAEIKRKLDKACLESQLQIDERAIIPAETSPRCRAHVIEARRIQSYRGDGPGWSEY